MRLSGTSPCGDALGDTLDDGGLADARLADEHRVVLGAPRQHLHHAADLLVAADDRVELALARQAGEVARVLLEGLVLALGLLVGDALGAAHLPHRHEERVAVEAARRKSLRVSASLFMAARATRARPRCTRP